MSDKRLQFNHHRVEHEGNVWNIDGKYDPQTNTLKVYRVYGDVTQPEVLDEALQILADDIGTMERRGPGRPKAVRA